MRPFPAKQKLGLLLILAACTAYAPPLLAEESSAEQLSVRRVAIEEEQAAVTRQRTELDALRKETLQQLNELNIGQIVRTMVEQAELKADTERVNLGGIEVELQSAEQTLATLTENVAELKKQIEAPRVNTAARAQLNSELTVQEGYLELEDQHVANLRAARYIASQRLDLAVRWAQELRSQYKIARELSDKAALGNLQTRLQKEQQQLLSQAAVLRTRLESVRGSSAEAEATRHALKTQLQVADEATKMKQTDLALSQVQGRLNEAQAVLQNQRASTEELGTALVHIGQLVSELNARAAFTEQKRVLLKQQQATVIKSLTLDSPARKQAIEDSRVLKGLLDDLAKQLKQIAFLQETVQQARASLLVRHESSRRAGLLVQQSLPGTLSGWQQLGAELLTVPQRLGQDVLAALASAVQKTAWAGWLLTALAELVWLGLVFWSQRWLDIWLVRVTSKTSSLIRIGRVVGRLVRTNLASITLVGAMFILLIAIGVTQPGLGVLTLFAMAWLFYRFSTGLARLLLLDPHYTHGERHPRLYRTLHLGILILSILTPLMLAGHVAELSLTVRGFIDRLFLFLLLPVFAVILLSRTSLLLPLSGVVSARWLRNSELTLIVLSLALLVSASVGVAGYLNLAWAIALHVGLFLGVLAAWLVLRGLVRDLFNILKRHAAKRSSDSLGPQTLLENLLQPLQRLTQFGLFVLAWWCLLLAYGWNADTPLVRDLRQLLITPLFEIAGNPITLFGLLLTVLIVAVVLRLGRWSRELTFRWLFYKISDSGTRHSLSVFSQYFVVLVGFLIALRVLGIDLTTLTVFAGALGVGIGFGLQNVANNFVSGILLLVERPVRTGDTVTIGGSEGEVTRIGIRSLTIKTSDSQDVIIPNSEVIAHAFTNWTYSDTLMRTLLTLPVHYRNDIHRAQALVEEALRQHPAVLKTPRPEVSLDEFTLTGVLLRVQYFTDLRSSNRQQVKSDVLLKIWDSFKQGQVRFPSQPDPAAPTG
jgi:potassium efflux system protein